MADDTLDALALAFGLNREGAELSFPAGQTAAERFKAICDAGGVKLPEPMLVVPTVRDESIYASRNQSTYVTFEELQEMQATWSTRPDWISAPANETYVTFEVDDSAFLAAVGRARDVADPTGDRPRERALGIDPDRVIDGEVGAKEIEG